MNDKKELTVDDYDEYGIPKKYLKQNEKKDEGLVLDIPDIVSYGIIAAIVYNIFKS